MYIHVYLVSTKPFVFDFQVIHVSVEVVEVVVLELMIINQVPLTPGIVVAVTVPLARKVQPLRMTKLIACYNSSSYMQIVVRLYMTIFQYGLLRSQIWAHMQHIKNPSGYSVIFLSYKVNTCKYIGSLGRFLMQPNVQKQDLIQKDKDTRTALDTTRDRKEWIHFCKNLKFWPKPSSSAYTCGVTRGCRHLGAR